MSRLDPDVRRVLDTLIGPGRWHLEQRAKHIAIMVDGRMVSGLARGGHKGGRGAHLRVAREIRRALCGTAGPW